MTCSGSDCFQLGTGACWDLLDDRKTCEYPDVICQELSVSHRAVGVEKAKLQCLGKKPIFLSFSMNCLFFCFLTQQRVLLFSLQRAVLHVCITALHRSPQGCMMHEEPHQECCKGLLPLRPPPSSPESTGGDLGALLGTGAGAGGLGLSEVSSLGCSLEKPYGGRTAVLLGRHATRWRTELVTPGL